MIEQSAEIGNLAAAFAKAQATIEGAVKGKVNPAFRSKYADLASVWDACREQLTENGLSVVQFPGEVVDGRMALTTQLIHASGEWMRATMSVPLAKADPQGAGSALTYARRYALAAVVGVCPEDDDGNAASRPQPQQSADDTRISEADWTLLSTLAQQSGADLRAFCTFYKIESLRDMPVAKFAHAKSALEKKLAAKGGSNGAAH